MSEKDDVTYPFDPLNPPVLTDDQRGRLAALAAMPDEDIDTSDIPPLTERFFARAVRNPYFRSAKPSKAKPIHQSPHPEVPERSGGLEGDLQFARCFLEGSFEAR